MCKNCDIKHYALSHYNGGLCRERYSWNGGVGVCRVAEMHVSRLRKEQGLVGGVGVGNFRQEGDAVENVRIVGGGGVF